MDMERVNALAAQLKLQANDLAILDLTGWFKRACKKISVKCTRISYIPSETPGEPGEVEFIVTNTDGSSIKKDSETYNKVSVARTKFMHKFERAAAARAEKIMAHTSMRVCACCGTHKLIHKEN